MNNVFVYCEIDKYTVEEVSLELLTKGRKLANQLGVQLEAIAAGSGITGKVEKDILSYGVDKLHVFDAEGLYPYTSKPHTSILVNLFKEEQPQICLMGATVIGRDLGPRVSSSLTSGLTADCTALEIDPESKLLWQTRPAFGGNIMATIMCPDHRPQMATVRPKVFRKTPPDTSRKGEILEEVLNQITARTKLLKTQHAADGLDISAAEIIVSGGRGLGKAENFSLVRELADLLGGVVGSSRACVDAGWIGASHQVGQTGKTVCPKLYLALGISGAIQHTAGMANSDCIIAVNKDPDAPIFQVADLGIVGDLQIIVPRLIAALKAKAKEGK